MKNGNATATWAGVSAFFATLLAVGAIDIFNPSDQIRLLSSIIVGLITAGAIYSKQRLEEAKLGRVHGGVIRVTEVGDKKVYSLELEGDPAQLEDKREVIFNVQVHKAVD